ncbi:MAG: replication-associated recombination protein A [Oscillospiraceae bacterium]
MAIPLAERIRPTTLDDVVGQTHIISDGKPLRRIIQSKELPNMIFYGPSGVGKTTVARIIASATNMRLHKLNGTNCSISDIKSIVEEINTIAGYNGILLYLDEIQYLNKKQQQSLLEYIENGSITLIASTTENPYFYIYNAILSRSTVFEFKSVDSQDIKKATKRAFELIKLDSSCEAVVEEGVCDYISKNCGGDVRKAVNTVELCFLAADYKDDKKYVSLTLARELTQKSSMRYDKDGDEHYEILSAFQKSIRGSDENAALHYLARLIEAGDILSPCRRLLVIACEDVGLAYPQAISIVKACVDSAVQLGLPEARIPLAQAVILLATAPKSNSAYMAIAAALNDVKNGKVGVIPKHLQNAHYDADTKDLTRAEGYQYPHDFTNHYCKQEYMPSGLEGTVYYNFSENKNEQAAYLYRNKISQEK